MNHDQALQIFISYSWRNTAEIDLLDQDLQKLGITLVRDIRDLKPWENIETFTQRITAMDYVLLMISDPYIKSQNCMSEAIYLMDTDPQFDKKTLPIMIGNVHLEQKSKVRKYEDYWRNEEKRLATQVERGSQTVIQDLKIVSQITANFSKFTDYLRGIILVPYSDLKAQNYQIFFQRIGYNPQQVGQLQALMAITEIETDRERQDLALDKFLKAHPGHREGLFYKAYLANERGEYQRAKDYYEDLLRQSGNFALAYNNLGIILSDQFLEFEKAEDCLKKAIQSDSNLAKAYFNLAKLFENDYFKRYQEARFYYEKAIRLFPTYFEAYNNLAVLLISDEFKEYSRAKNYLETAITINPGFAEAYFNLGKLMGNDYYHDYEKAKQFYEKTLVINPQYISAYINLAALLQGSYFRNYQKAEEYYQKLFMLAPNVARVYYNYACLHALKEVDTNNSTSNKLKIFQNLKKAIILNPEFRIIAQNDMDFNSFRDDPDFQKIVSL
ncbi:MAG: tetratricopeptide repeat protein [Firmicutes bacterium]|nr:tetratricopeptide repeat protein [Bacillota bacterium]